MKNILKKIGTMIMALSTMVAMSAYSQLNNSTAKKVCDALTEYSEKMPYPDNFRIRHFSITFSF